MTGKNVKWRGAGYIFLLTILTFIGTFGCSVKKATTSEQVKVLKTGWYFVTAEAAAVTLELTPGQPYQVNPQPIVTAKNFTETNLEAPVSGKEAPWSVVVQLDDAGSKAFQHATKQSIGHDMAFIVDNKLFLVVRIQAEIPGGIFNLSKIDFTKSDAAHLKAKLQSGL